MSTNSESFTKSKVIRKKDHSFFCLNFLIAGYNVIESTEEILKTTQPDLSFYIIPLLLLASV